MTNTRPSLLERAAEIYDFSSGQRVAPVPADLPPPRTRRPVAVEAVPDVRAEPHPVSAPPPVPVQQAPKQVAPLPVARPKPSHRPVQHARAEIDRAALARSGFLTPDAPATGLAEEFRLIKRRLLRAVDERMGHGDHRARIVLVASGKPGDGKTFIAANLALSIAAEQDRTVLLIDGDSAKPDLMERLGLEDGPGFIDALADHRLDPEALVLATDIERLAVLPAGRKERNVPELLASERTEDVLERLLSADPRRIVIIDSPPVLAASSAGVLAARAGQALVVVRADETSEADLNETIDLLSACPNLSMVLNSTAFQVGGRRFGQYEEYR